MLKINNVKIKLEEQDYARKISQLIHIHKSKIHNITLVKQSIDARRDVVRFICSFTFETDHEEQLLIKHPGLQLSTVEPYDYPKGTPNSEHVIVVGSGPAGLFCAYQLARSGQKVTVIERGSCVEKRKEDIASFFQGQPLNEESNIQFGEGGAGTFSDGKLTSGSKNDRKQFVLETFVKHGATKDILYLNKPHVGTDYLIEIVKNMREYITTHGGEFLFDTKLVDIVIKNNKINKIVVENKKNTTTMDVDRLVLAIGHSARDTYKMLYGHGLSISQKPFAVGLRIEHEQSFINEHQYGKFVSHPSLKSADYKLAVKTANHRGVYTFCMCPGGKVINASSESKRLVVNGMSNYERDDQNGNSAIVVSVDTQDFKDEHPLAGMYFQIELEEKAYQLGGNDGSVPVQRVEEYLGDSTKSTLSITPSVLPKIKYVDLESLFSKEINESLKEGLQLMNKRFVGFTKNAILTGVESRSSAPIRIYRSVAYESSVLGIYPIGEGAGYAGGIMSSAMDGLQCAEILLEGEI